MANYKNYNSAMLQPGDRPGRLHGMSFIRENYRWACLAQSVL